MDTTTEPVRTWQHSRKGRIQGVIVSDDGEWVDIRLVGDHELSMVSLPGFRNDGEVVTVRKSFLTEVHL